MRTPLPARTAPVASVAAATRRATLRGRAAPLRRVLPYLLSALVLAPAASLAQTSARGDDARVPLYRWVDAKGVTRYTADPARVPEALRALGASAATAESEHERWVLRDYEPDAEENAGDADDAARSSELDRALTRLGARAAQGDDADAGERANDAGDASTSDTSERTNPADARAELDERIAFLEQRIAYTEDRIKRRVTGADDERAEGGDNLKALLGVLPELREELQALRARREALAD